MPDMWEVFLNVFSQSIPTKKPHILTKIYIWGRMERIYSYIAQIHSPCQDYSCGMGIQAV